MSAHNHGISDADAWVDPETFKRIHQAATEVGMERLKPIHEALEESVSYDEIRIALACLRNVPPEEADIVPTCENDPVCR